MEQVYGRGSAVEGGSHPDPGTGLEEPIWQLALEGRGGGGGDSVYPERPGEPDCNYYMRTGSCGYGDRCRYNHPRNRAMIAASARTGGGEYPERAGQPLCQYFLKTGTCKFGATCKYHHPRQGGPVYPPQLNVYGYPLRPGEKECSYYVKTGHCKFGATCKFHHPQPAVTSVPAPAPPFYPTMQSPSVHSPHQLSAVAGWQVARSPPQMPGSYVQGPYGHVILASGMVPGWSPFPPPVNPVVPPGGQPAVEAGSLYGLSPQLSPSVPTYIGPYQPASPSAGPSSSGQREHLFPERPGQPECQYYMKTGDCKFGSTCKYHHPPERSVPKTSYFLNPMGLPLRPGAPSCTFFAQHGVCKFGPSCKFDHPMVILGYGPSASSLSDMSVAAPFPVGISPELLAPSSSSTDLRHEFVAGPSNKDSFSTQMPSGGNTSSSSIGSIFSKDEIVSHSFVQAPLQSSTPSSSSSSISHGGEVTSSR